jgi:hypothetical protein
LDALGHRFEGPLIGVNGGHASETPWGWEGAPRTFVAQKRVDLVDFWNVIDQQKPPTFRLDELGQVVQGFFRMLIALFLLPAMTK